MAKQQAIEQFGEVIEDCSRGFFNVKLQDSDHIVHCTLSGKMRTNYVRIIVGDKVKIEISPYDLTKGRITFRLRTDDRSRTSSAFPSSVKKTKKDTVKPKKRK